MKKECENNISDEKGESHTNKRALFIGMGFYDYENSIVQEMETQGIDVDYYKLGNQNIEIKVAKYIPQIMNFVVNKLNRKLIKKIKNDYNYVIIIKGDFCRPFMLKELRKKLKAKFIMYQWDSIAKVKNFEEVEEYFDCIYTFDRKDALNYDKLKFRPLFFRHEYSQGNEGTEVLEYDIYSISTYYNYRYEFFKKIMDQFSNRKKFLKLRVGIRFYYRSFFFRGKKLDRDLLIFNAMSAKENLELMRKSSVILDVCNPTQNGLTMRTIEAIGMNKKSITTNKDIVNYDFYNKNNIYIVDPDDIIIDEDFFDSSYITLKDEIYKRYSITQWVIDIVSD